LYRLAIGIEGPGSSTVRGSLLPSFLDVVVIGAADLIEMGYFLYNCGALASAMTLLGIQW